MIFDTRHDRGARRALLFNTIFCLPFFNHCCTFFFPTFFSPCHLLSSSFFSLSPLVVTQIRGHVASLPPPHCGSCLAFLSREDLSPFFPRRHAPCMYLFLTKTLRDPQPSQQKNYPHTTVFIIPTAFIIPPPWADVPCSISRQLEYCRCQKGQRWKHLAESFPKTHRSVLAPSWLSSSRVWKKPPQGGVIYTVVYGTAPYISIAPCQYHAG